MHRTSSSILWSHLTRRTKLLSRLSEVQARVQTLSAAASEHVDQLPDYRTEEHDPRRHTNSHRGRLYTVPQDVIQRFGKEINTQENRNAINYFAPKDFTDRCELFRETCLLVRDPALEILQNIENSDLNSPAIRYVLYGRDGVGKTTTISHLIHWGHASGYVTMPFAWIKKWMSRYYEVAPSTYREGDIDHVNNATVFMKNFKQANAEALENCVTHKDYTWSVREKTEKGAPLMEVVDVACERLNFAADAMNIVMKELKLNCNDGRAKLLVCLDGVNSLFCEKTMIHRTNTQWKHDLGKNRDFQENHRAQVDECSVLRNIKKLLLNDYKNAVIVTSVDKEARVIPRDPGHKYWVTQERDYKPDTSSHLPFSLLGQVGWEIMDPFIPIEVLPYSETEMDTMIDYYMEKRYIMQECGTHSGRQEIHFLTGRNPKDFFVFSNDF